jgi:SnoaL-like protein
MIRRADLRILGIVAIVVAAVGFGWRAVFPSDERQIRRQLTQVAEAVNEQRQGLSAIAQAADVASAFADDVVIDLGEGAPIRGRETLMAIVARLQPRTSRYEVRIRDMNVQVDAGESASVDLSATTSGDNGMDAREFQLQMVKREGKWLIARVKPVAVLEK